MAASVGDTLIRGSGWTLSTTGGTVVPAGDELMTTDVAPKRIGAPNRIWHRGSDEEGRSALNLDSDRHRAVTAGIAALQLGSRRTAAADTALGHMMSPFTCASQVNGTK